MARKLKTRAELRARAERAIEQRKHVCFDICAETSQIFDNVSHMRWFLLAVMDELDDPEIYDRPQTNRTHH